MSHPGHHSLHLTGRVAAVVFQGGAPQGLTGQRGVYSVERQPESSSREQRSRDMDQVIIQETNLQRVLGQEVGQLINLTSLGVAPEIKQDELNKLLKLSDPLLLHSKLSQVGSEESSASSE